MNNKKYYSGKNSTEFWNRISRFKGIEHDALYSMGVVLQNLESDVLKMLSLAEENLIEEIKNGQGLNDD
jgi:hypothetical protein